MSTKIIYIVIALAVVGGGAYLISSKDTNESAQTGEEGEMQEQQSETEGMQEVSGFTGSVQDLLARGENISCTFRHSDEFGVSEGTFYVAGGQNKMRGDFTYSSSAEDTPYEGGMIHDGTTIYTWSETSEGTFGMKMPVEDGDIESMYDSEAYESGQQFNPTTEVEYDCSSWNVEQSMFVPPSSIDFMDYNAQMQQMQQMQESMQGSSGIDCSSCDSIPDETMRAQCRESLQCE